MKKLGIVIADGVGYRNFVMSDFLKESKLQFDKIVIYSGLLKSVYTAKDLVGVEFRELDIYHESKTSWFYRKLKEVAHLQHHKGYFGIKCSLDNGNPKTVRTNRAKLTKLIYLLAKFLNSEKWIKKFEKLQYQSFKKENCYKTYLEYFKEDRPTHLFFTHQRPANLAPVLGAAKDCSIKTSSFIFSWDNLASKGRMLGTFDSFLVWSSLMKDELKYFYPQTNSNKIHIIGTPQFEPYVLERYFKEKKYFYSRFGLEEFKKTIYYSCGDVSTSKSDPLYIDTIAKFIVNNQIEEPVNFIVRTSPAEDGSRFLELKKQYPFIKWNFPKWNLTRENHTEVWSQRVPEFEDLCDLRALLMYADVNINMCSTMSLDFMIFNKPVINAVFGNEVNGLYNDQKYLNYTHYKSVAESGSVNVALSEAELLDAINDSLKNPLKFEKQRKEILNLEIGKPLKDTSKRIVKALIELSE